MEEDNKQEACMIWMWIRIIMGVVCLAAGIWSFIKLKGPGELEFFLSPFLFTFGWILMFRPMREMLPHYHVGLVIMLATFIIPVAIGLFFFHYSRHFSASPSENSKENSYEPIVHEHFGNMLTRGELGDDKFRS